MLRTLDCSASNVHGRTEHTSMLLNEKLKNSYVSLVSCVQVNTQPPWCIVIIACGCLNKQNKVTLQLRMNRNDNKFLYRSWSYTKYMWMYYCCCADLVSRINLQHWRPGSHLALDWNLAPLKAFWGRMQNINIYANIIPLGFTHGGLGTKVL